MRVDLFDFELPPERIALRPARPRDSARMLVVPGEGAFDDRHVRDLPQFLRKGDVLVFNDTRVIPAQLEGKRGEAKIGATLHKREDLRRWQAFIRNAKRLRPGARIEFPEGVSALAETRHDDGSWTLFFEGEEPVEVLLERAGTMPLPPYIAAQRAPDEQDKADYQTLFADAEGSVAAPTAGLHFTDELTARLKAREVSLHRLTLHVGAGTFLPVKADDTTGHKMHAEWGTVSRPVADELNEVRKNGGRIVATGSTSLRLLESAADESGTIKPFSGETSIFITPGYKFHAVDLMLTNFHLPRSTLFMLVSAFSGLETMQRAYAHAIAGGYRFYSYGDACLLFPERR